MISHHNGTNPYASDTKPAEPARAGGKQRLGDGLGESAKAACAIVFIVASVAAAVAWSSDRPDAMTWSFRVCGLIIAPLAVGTILKLHFRADLAHDYLRDIAGTYFNRDGFCFTFVVAAVEGVAYMNAYFQNQRDERCLGRIAVRPARGFFMGRHGVETLTYEIDCAPAAFGVARIAVPIPVKLQGKRQSFEVGASVSYPDGRGHRLRFRDGVFLRANSKFKDAFRTGATIAGAAVGVIVFSRPVTLKIDLPAGVAEKISDHATPEIRTLWQLGCPPMAVAG